MRVTDPLHPRRSYNAIGDAGATSIASALPGLARLRHLNLGCAACSALIRGGEVGRGWLKPVGSVGLFLHRVVAGILYRVVYNFPVGSEFCMLFLHGL